MNTLEVTYLNRKCNEQKLHLPEEVTSLRITLSTGHQIEVELFEREGLEGRIAVRGNRVLGIIPSASNVIYVGVLSPYYSV